MVEIGRHFYMLSEEVLAVAEQAMKDLLERSHARACLFVDRSGYLILQCGKFHALHPEEMAAVGAGVFGALQNLVNMSESHELTVNFHTKELDNIHFLQVTHNVFLVVIYRFYEVTEEEIRKRSGEFLEAIAPLLKKEETEKSDWGTVQFIHNKLDELFED